MRKLLKCAAVLGLVWGAFASIPQNVSADPPGPGECCNACMSAFSACEPHFSAGCYDAYYACIGPCNDPFCLS
jgi:hypothetical protein